MHCYVTLFRLAYFYSGPNVTNIVLVIFQILFCYMRISFQPAFLVCHRSKLQTIVNINRLPVTPGVYAECRLSSSDDSSKSRPQSS